jgi:hypothetical protein
MAYRFSCLLLSLLALTGCGERDEPRAASTPTPAPVANPAAQAVPVETRRAVIAQRLSKRPLSETLRARLVEAWVAGSDGFDQAAMDRLLVAIDSSIEAVDENRFNATKDLAEGRPAVAGSTIMGALISGLVAEAGGRMPLAVDCGGIRANGWVERRSSRSNRATVIITSLSVQETSGKNVTYQHPDGLAYLMGPDGLEGLTLQTVTDQRGNSWLGLRAGTLVTLILIRAVDQTVVAQGALAAPAASAPASAPKPSTPAPAPSDQAPAEKPAPAVNAEQPAVGATESPAPAPVPAPAPAPAPATPETKSP